jgi:hypothetical protein
VGAVSVVAGAVSVVGAGAEGAVVSVAAGVCDAAAAGCGALSAVEEAAAGADVSFLSSSSKLRCCFLLGKHGRQFML